MASDIRYINKKIGLFCFFLYFSFHGIAQDWKVYPHTPEGSRISFPKDEGRHPNDSVEWWYI